MGLIQTLKKKKEAFLEIRSSNIAKRQKSREERVAQMRKENKLLREEAKARQEYKQMKKENFELKNPLVAKAHKGIKAKLKENKSKGFQPNPIFHGTGSNPFMTDNKKKKKGDNGKGIFY